MTEPSSTPVPYATFRARRGVFEDDWRAKVTPKRPWPVVMIHGTGHAKGVWEDLGGELRKDGWAVFAPDYGYRATGPLSESLDQLSAYIDQVLAATGGRRAIIVGHSQGGLLATLLSFRNSHTTRHVVCLAAPNHGTSLGGVAAGLLRIPGTRNLVNNFVQSYWGTSGIEQLTGSPMVESIAQADVTAPGVTYSCIASRTDQLINPPSSCFLDDGGQGTVNNIWIQDLFPQAVVLHEHTATDRRVRAIVREELLKLVNESFAATAFLAEDEPTERRLFLGGKSSRDSDDGAGDDAGARDGADDGGDADSAAGDSLSDEDLGRHPEDPLHYEDDFDEGGANLTSFASLLAAFMYREGFSDWAERAGLTGLQGLAESRGSGGKFKWGRSSSDDDDGDSGSGDSGSGDGDGDGSVDDGLGDEAIGGEADNEPMDGSSDADAVEVANQGDRDGGANPRDADAGAPHGHSNEDGFDGADGTGDRDEESSGD